MSEPAFTKGPWHVERIYGDPCVTPHRDGVKNSPWCKQFHVSYEADAHLIAAAPSLYEVLDWALDLLDMYDERLIELGDPRDLVYSPIHVEGKRIARAALALARGEAP